VPLTFDPILAFYAVPLLVVWTVYLGMRKKVDVRSRSTQAEAKEAGLTEPASLHPLIDPVLCLGCGACVRACPEVASGHPVLGIIDDRAELIEPASCIGHGACKTACPTDAITLVFGTETRGVELPIVKPDFQTNVPGLFIAGELGGMGLIRNAIEQGRQAMESVKALGAGGQTGDMLDVVIIGAGPAGFSASLGALGHKLKFVTLEQDSFGGTVGHFPRGKLVMTAPAMLPLIGRMQFREVSKETLMAFWHDALKKTGLTIRYGERVESVTRQGAGFIVKSSANSYQARSVLLAIGRRGTPRKLEVPGEEQSKVVYRLIDPEQYRGQHVVVVGGGDSALEAAASIAEEAGTTVTLSYRSEAFGRAKQKNRVRVDAAVKAGSLTVMLKSKIKAIGEKDIQIEHDGKKLTLKNDAVIVCAGGILPTAFLKSCGIEVETKYGTA
jgi:thioredoxin reductase/NAD-dependent dihydropyrimidine dehydrogenase PreA subunit